MKRPETSEQNGGHPCRRLWLGCLILTVGCGLVYGSLFKADFINYDDSDYVFQNHAVLQGLNWKTTVWAFTESKSANWHPLTWLSHMLDYQLFGLQAGFHHLTNLLFHTANTLLLFLCFAQVTKAVWRSFFVAGLFAFHPLHVESVAWISERKDVLSGFFFLLTLWAYFRYVAAQPRNIFPRHSRAIGWYVVSLALLAAGLMSKPMLVTLPCVLLLLDYWPLRRQPGWTEKSPQKMRPPAARFLSLLVEKIPFFVLSLASSLTTFLVQRKAGAVSSIDTLPLADRLGNAVLAYVRYLGKTFWPVDLAVFYPHPGTWPMGTVAIAALILILITALTLAQAKRPYLAVGWFWFLGMLVPVIGLVQVGSQSMADRYMYLPAIGLFLSLVWLGADLWPKSLKSRPWIAGGVVALVLAGAAGLAWVQVGHWKNSEQLFRHALKVTRNNHVAEFCLGNALIEQDKIEEGRQHLKAAVRIHPRFSNVYGALAVLETKEGRYEQAILIYEEALRQQPDSGEALNNLAWLLATCPDPKFRDGPAAVAHGSRACELTRYKIAIYIGTLAAAYAEAGRFEEAVQTAQKACDVARLRGEEQLVKRNQELQQLYAARKPYHESPKPR